MCGRFTNSGTSEEVGSFFGVTQVGDGLPLPSWNIRPTDQVDVVLESAKDEEAPVRRLEAARWSLVRPGAKELKGRFPLFNVRSETAAEKFPWALKHRRAIMPLESYYEWRTEGWTKTPFTIHPTDDRFLAAAAVTSWWKNPELAEDDPARWVLTAAMLTMDAAPHLAGIHDRNPVFLPRDFWADWLSPSLEGDQALVDAAVQSAKPVAAGLAFHEVRPLKGNGPELLEPA
jgi:putative SOS response-associated peptidase YedK